MVVGRWSVIPRAPSIFFISFCRPSSSLESFLSVFGSLEFGTRLSTAMDRGSTALESFFAGKTPVYAPSTAFDPPRIRTTCCQCVAKYGAQCKKPNDCNAAQLFAKQLAHEWARASSVCSDEPWAMAGGRRLRDHGLWPSGNWPMNGAPLRSGGARAGTRL